MSPIGIASTLFNLVSSVGGSASSSSSNAAGSTSASSSSSRGDFSSSLALRMASLQAGSTNAVNVLSNLSAGNGGVSSALDFLSSTGQSDSFSFPGLNGKHGGLSASGRNFSLFDPESGYRMMSNINNRDANYKAQFSELSEMKTDVAEMQQAGQALVSGLESLDNEGIKAKLQAFADKYNEWVDRFDDTVQAGGVLSGTQAAEVSLYELEQGIENRFNGAMHGLNGMRDLGLSIDPHTHMASFDTAKLDATLSSNREGAINTIGEFSSNFAKSAELLISSNNFIPNRLNNLDRVIDYIADNKASLQAEFGLGDPAKPSPLVAKALAAYQQMFKA